VGHTEAPEVAERVRNALVAAYQPRDCFVTLATGVLGTHVGPGAWAIFYQVEDGPATEAGRRDSGTTQ
jgi:fatty acid-binding protein DegV